MTRFLCCWWRVNRSTHGDVNGFETSADYPRHGGASFGPDYKSLFAVLLVANDERDAFRRPRLIDFYFRSPVIFPYAAGFYLNRVQS